MLFDVHIDAEGLVHRPYRERRERLHGLVAPGRHWQVPEVFSDAEAALEATRRLDLEGIVCKQHASSYRPGRRSRTWTKVKHAHVADVVIGGWLLAGSPARQRVSALLLGVPDGSGRLRYVGTVKTGFTDAARRDLAVRLRAIGASATFHRSAGGRTASRRALGLARARGRGPHLGVDRQPAPTAGDLARTTTRPKPGRRRADARPLTPAAGKAAKRRALLTGPSGASR
ncbi:hypothetical protein [Nonomuraea wenchangensis]|uniref:ATP-dependent DNA ligase n=1 Tax=Nonomuraea wenchangensis TaxID=568860 RepID=UPI003D9F7875